MTYKLSPSSLNLMLDCQRCFWLDKHKGTIKILYDKDKKYLENGVY